MSKTTGLNNIWGDRDKKMVLTRVSGDSEQTNLNADGHWRTENGAHVSIIEPLSSFPFVESYRTIVDISRSNELACGFMDRSRCLKVLQVKVL